VNPGILQQAGVPFAGAATATALGAALMCICMGLIANRPLALASGMGLNAVLTFSVIGFAQSNVPWQVGMAVIFLDGVIMFILVMTGFREMVFDAIPLDLKRAIGVGIGLFITTIGLNEGGIIAPNSATLVSLGDFTQRYVWVALIGLAAILVFMALKIKGDILWGILVATAAAVLFGVTKLPTAIVAAPSFQTFFAPFQTVTSKTAGTGMAITQVLTPALLVAVFAILLTDFFDTIGTTVAVGEQAGFVKDGKVPGLRRILGVDGAAAAVGGLFGASSITTYIESASGVAEGGRTGLVPIVVGVLFALSAFFAPIVQMIGGGFDVGNATHFGQLADAGFKVPVGSYFMYPVTAGALIVVGFLMMRSIREIPWTNFEEAFPAFLTIVGIPLTYNISYGIGFGFISYVIIKLLHRKGGQVHWLMYCVSAAFLVAFLQAPITAMLSK
jgi:AGZA family xanthine/uracil permease-like MFS transporter